MSSGFDDANDIPQQSSPTPPGDESILEQTPEPLRRAAQRWQRRGYTIRYADAFLTQLVRRTGIGWIGWVLLVLAVPPLALALWLLTRVLRRRGWHVVSLTVTPEGRVLSHRQWTRAKQS